MKFRGTATYPDETTYSLVIHLRRMKGETEKALDNLNDMTAVRKLEPNVYHYNAIIHACASRKDYYHQAWQYAKEMQAKGFPMENRVLNLLILAASRVGDLWRARMLVR